MVHASAIKEHRSGQLSLLLWCRPWSGFSGFDWNLGQSRLSGDGLGLGVGVTVGDGLVGAGEDAGTSGAIRSAWGLGLGMAVAVRARARAIRVLWKCILGGIYVVGCIN